MYLSVAEKERLNLFNSPQKTPELYEKFLPWALALEVEQQWSEQFSEVLEKAMKEDNYSPSWYHSGQPFTSAGLASSLGSSLSSTISSSSRAPGSSSGSSGGGSSGGGGAGGLGGGSRGTADDAGRVGLHPLPSQRPSSGQSERQSWRSGGLLRRCGFVLRGGLSEQCSGGRDSFLDYGLRCADAGPAQVAEDYLRYLRALGDQRDDRRDQEAWP